jgi:hypothetical protein
MGEVMLKKEPKKKPKKVAFGENWLVEQGNENKLPREAKFASSRARKRQSTSFE